jgi:DNA-binding response OmpR family regulator
MAETHGGGRPYEGIVQRKGNILVVEPDDLILGLLDRWLGEAGYSVAARTLRKLAANRMREAAPHLIIADVPDPRGTGELVQLLRDAYRSPILMISARFRRELSGSVEVARELGVRKILPKPFTREELLAAVGELIEST